MYVIKRVSRFSGTDMYWTGRRYRKSYVWSDRIADAKQYRTARGACTAVMRHKSRCSNWEKNPWQGAYVATSIGVW